MDIKCFLVEAFFLDSDETIEGYIPARSEANYSYRRTDTKEDLKVKHFHQCPPGAMIRAFWLEDMPSMTGADGTSWKVMTPGGIWSIDSEASNCTRKNDTTHKCWCRHGVAPNFTVNKSGNTCSAGAGSIMIGGYHGFLRNGFLITA